MTICCQKDYPLRRNVCLNVEKICFRLKIEDLDGIVVMQDLHLIRDNSKAHLYSQLNHIFLFFFFFVKISFILFFLDVYVKLKFNFNLIKINYILILRFLS